MDVMWTELQALFVLVLWLPLAHLAAYTVGAALLLALADLLMYAVVRALSRLGLLV